MTPKYCFIHNYAQHYRLGIFKKLNYSFDFYFGDKIKGDIKKLNYSQLSNFRGELKNVSLIRYPIYFQIGAVNLLFRDYRKFLMLGEYYCLSTWIILIFSKILNKDVYLWTHGWYGNESLIIRFTKKIFYKLSSGIFLYGDYAKCLMLKEGFDREKLHVLYNSLDYQSQLEIRKTLKRTSIFEDHFKNKSPNLIFIGRLTKIKCLDNLLFAMEALGKKNNLCLNLTLVGDGPEREYLEQIGKKLKLKIWFFGSCYDENILGNLIYNSDLCVSPGNVGLTAMHSLGFGTPVITHDDFTKQMPEFEAIIPGKTGDFFVYNNIESLSEIIIKWVTENKNQRELIRNYCHDIIDKKYNPEFQSQVILKIMDQ